MLQRNISYHISEDRLDRACYIMTTIGIGDIIKEVHTIDEQGRGAWKCFTNTGVMLIFNEKRTRVVTLYIASQPQVSAMYQGNTPGWILRMVKKNIPHAKKQNGVKTRGNSPRFFIRACSSATRGSSKINKLGNFLQRFFRHFAILQFPIIGAIMMVQKERRYDYDPS